MRFHAWDGNLEVQSPIFGFTRIATWQISHDYPEGYVTFWSENEPRSSSSNAKPRRWFVIWDHFDWTSIVDPSLYWASYWHEAVPLSEDQHLRYPLRPWAQQLLRDLWSQRSNACRGVLNALCTQAYTLVAAHFGLREGKWLHYWFPTYDPEFHQYSQELLPFS